MSFRIASCGFGLALALVCGVLSVSAQSDGKATHGRSLELTEPTVKDVVTNLNQLTGRSGLQQLEDDLSKSLQPLSPRGSLDGMLAPPYIPRPVVPVVRSKKLKDELDRRQNWMFLSPSDMLPSTDDSDLLKPQDGTQTDQSKQSPLEQFYNRLEREQKAVLKSRSNPDGSPLGAMDGSSSDSSSPDDARLPGAIRDSAQNLKKLLNSDGPDAFSSDGRGTLSDLFGLGENRGPSREDLERHKAYMDEYRKVLDVTATPSLFDASKTAATTVSAPNGTLNSLMVPGSHLTAETTLGTLGTVVNPGVLPDVNSATLNQWNPLYNPQLKVEAPKPTSFGVPMPEAPRRRF